MLRYPVPRFPPGGVRNVIFGWRKGESGSGAKEFEPQPDKARKHISGALEALGCAALT